VIKDFEKAKTSMKIEMKRLVVQLSQYERKNLNRLIERIKDLDSRLNN